MHNNRHGVSTEAGNILTPIAYGVIDADHVKNDLLNLRRNAAGPRFPLATSTVFKSVGNAV